MRLEDLNALSPGQATDELLKCCGAVNWAQLMVDRRPFSSLPDLLTTAAGVWWSLERSDWLEAFRSHPKIGEQKAARHLSVNAQKWSEQEQSSLSDAALDTRQALARLNQEYERKFGFIYIVCASGKSPEEMLAILKDRMDNAPESELRVAAAEQAKITQLRLKKLLEP